MRRIIFPFLSAILIFLFSSCGPSEKDIIAYNDEIVVQQNAIIIAENELLTAISNRDSNIVPIAYDDLLFQIEKSINAVNEVSEMDEEFSLKKVALSMFNKYKKIVKNEYKEVIELTFLPASEYTKEKDSIFMIKSAKINEELNQANQQFFDTQQNLSKKHGIAFKIFQDDK